MPDELNPKLKEFARNWMAETYDPRVLHIEGAPDGLEPPELPDEFYEARLGRTEEARPVDPEPPDLPPSPLVAVARPQTRPQAPQILPLTLQVSDHQASFRGHSVTLDDEEHAVIAAVVLSAVQKRLNAQLGEIKAQFEPPPEPPKRKRGRPRKVQPGV